MIECRFPQSLSMIISKMCCFFLSLYDGDNIFQRHSIFWYPATSSLVFSIFFYFAIFNPPNLNFFSTSLFSEIYYTFCFENLLHVNFQFLIGWKNLFYYISKKNHIWLIRKVEHCLTSYMINHNAQKSSGFLKYIL